MNDPRKLHTAANNCDTACLRRLLAEGLSPDHRSESGLTPLHRVCLAHTTTGDHEACFRLLRDAGANLEATAAGGYAPLHYAAENRKPFLVSMLIEAGANVNVTNSYGATPLHIAVTWRSEAMVAMLVKAGAAVNAKDDWGKRPLHNARDYDNTRICPILLRAGATLVPCPKCEPPRSLIREPTGRTSTEQYLWRVTDAGGFKEYRHNHLVKFTSTCASKLRLPAAPARLVAEFWAHAGYY